MTNADAEALEGKTLSVYSYVVKEGKPIGPRDVMRGANLSSPSLAYFHLQKLESYGLLEKNVYGEYVVKEKVNVSGHLWIGRKLVPRLIFYSLFFMAVMGTELTIIFGQIAIQGKMPSTDMVYLAVTNGLATLLFVFEGLQLKQRTKLSEQKSTLKSSKNRDS